MNMKALTFLCAFFALSAHAGLPPTTLKGASDAGATTTFGFQVPFNQATRVSGTVGRIETGNLNMMPNPGIEASSLNWSTFDEGAVSAPVDMTGGSSTQLTVSATTTAGEVLSESKSLKVVKAAADAQGEGLSATLTIPPAYQGKNATISIPFKVTSGSIVSGDVKVFVYDVTNSTLITPFNNDIIGTSGTIQATFPVTASASTPANQSYRLGIYFASTSTTAVTLVFDDVSVSPVVVAMGPVNSPWETWSLVAADFTGFGTPTNITARRRQMAGSIEAEITFTAGTTTATEARISLGNYTTASDYPTLQYIGTGGGSEANQMTPLAEASKSYIVLGKYVGGTTASLAKANGSAFGTGSTHSIKFSVRVQGLSGSLPLTSASTYRISNYLASGSRVTGSAPTRLGEYRSYLRNASARTWTETNGAPTASPSTANGIAIYKGNAWGSADTNNSPTRYEIFIGKNKNYSMEWYNDASRTGDIDTGLYVFSSAEAGYAQSYDPTTGILSLNRTTNLGASSATHYPGVRPSTSEPTAATVVYFDIIVSEPAIPVQVESFPQVAYLKDVKASGTEGGASTSGSFQTRTLNTLENPGSYGWISLASNQFTLQAGEYEVEWSAPCFASDGHISKLRNVTDGSDLQVGSAGYSSASAHASTHSLGTYRFTIGSAKVLEIQHRVQTSKASNGYGVGSSFSVSNIYTQVKVSKLR